MEETDTASVGRHPGAAGNSYGDSPVFTQIRLIRPIVSGFWLARIKQRSFSQRVGLQET